MYQTVRICSSGEVAMAVEMEHLRAPKENLQTWNLVIKIFVYSAVACAITLGLMAIFLV
jgi:hypothetical protein